MFDSELPDEDDMKLDTGFIEIVANMTKESLHKVHEGGEIDSSYANAALGILGHSNENCIDIYEAARQLNYDILESTDLAIVEGLRRYLDDISQYK